MSETELTTTEMFHEIPVRIVHGEKGPMIPLVDIAYGIGYDRISLHRLYKRNSELFENYHGVVVMTAGATEQEHLCFTRDGVIGILMKLDYRRIKIQLYGCIRELLKNLSQTVIMTSWDELRSVRHFFLIQSRVIAW